MPGGFASIDTGFPDLNKYGNNTEAKLKAIESYLVQLLEHLRYTLNNLGAENFNEASLRQITDPLRVNVQGIYADEWKSGTSYYASDVVKISTADTVEYYKALADHTSSAANKPPSASWEKVSAPNVQSMLDIGLSGITLSYDNDKVGSGDHNASYIKLTKDGTEIAGGKVFIKDLDASTIKTGTLSADYISGGKLDAGSVVLKDAFAVKTGWRDGEYACGAIGGEYDSSNGGVLCLYSNDDDHFILVHDNGISLDSVAGSGGRTVEVTDSEVWIGCSKRVNGSLVSKSLRVDHDGVCIRDGSGAWKNLFDLF